MSLQRLTFLYPYFSKNVRVHESSQSFRALPSRKKRLRRSAFSTISKRRQETYAQRYGSAAEPLPPPPSMPGNLEGPRTLASAIENEVKGPRSKQEEKQPEEPQPKEPKKLNQEAKNPTEKSAEPTSSTLEKSSQSSQLTAKQSQPKDNNLATSREGMIKPVEAILQVGPPDAVQSQEHKLPHLHTPPYVHHFDTFTLVRDLQNGGFSEAQSITLMKAVRSLLAVNMDIAREGLISKSDVENVSPSPLCAVSTPPLLPQLISPRKFLRKPISSEPPAPNYARRSSTHGKPAQIRWGRSVRTCSMKLTSCPRKHHKTRLRSRTTFAGCSTTAKWLFAWISRPATVLFRNSITKSLSPSTAIARARSRG